MLTFNSILLSVLILSFINGLLFIVLPDIVSVGLRKFAAHSDLFLRLSCLSLFSVMGIVSIFWQSFGFLPHWHSFWIGLTIFIGSQTFIILFLPQIWREKILSLTLENCRQTGFYQIIFSILFAVIFIR